MSVLGPGPWQAAVTAAGWSGAVVPPGALLARWILARSGAEPRPATTPAGWARHRAARLRRTLHHLVTRLADLSRTR
jgi:hypothetical protein